MLTSATSSSNIRCYFDTADRAIAFFLIGQQTILICAQPDRAYISQYNIKKKVDDYLVSILVSMVLL